MPGLNKRYLSLIWRSLNAALLFNPWTLASRAKRSVVCRLSHCFEDALRHGESECPFGDLESEDERPAADEVQPFQRSEVHGRWRGNGLHCMTQGHESEGRKSTIDDFSVEEGCTAGVGDVLILYWS